MIPASDEYKVAVIGTVRQTFPRVGVDITDPDLVYTGESGSAEADYSQISEIHDRIMDGTPYATLEADRWLLNGTYDIIPDNDTPTSEVGYVSNAISGASGSFSTPQTVTLSFSGVTTLQACDIFFSPNERDGVAEDCTVAISRNGTTLYTETITGNSDTVLQIRGFTVADPTDITLTVTKWSVPRRRMRVLEMVAGVYLDWTGDDIVSIDIKHQADMSCLSLPYGTCDIEIDNSDLMFEPRNRSGMFEMLEERQPLSVKIGVQTEREIEYKPVGTFYQFANGWLSKTNARVVRWSLVDIVGLLSDRILVSRYGGESLPTTFEGWVSAMVDQLGAAFSGHYIIPNGYAELPITSDKDLVIGRTTGELLMMLGMAVGLYPYADQETGYLTFHKIAYTGDMGSEVTLDNMTVYPTIERNAAISKVTVEYGDLQASTMKQVTVAGIGGSAKAVTVSNPFVRNDDEAKAAAKNILLTSGGTLVTITGRGDPTTEIGDMDSVWLDESQAAAGARMMQTFSYSDGVLQGCEASFLRADGALLYEHREEFTAAGTFTVPEDVTQLRVILIGGGGGGYYYHAQSWRDTARGTDGKGGYVAIQDLEVTQGETYAISIGSGGAMGVNGTPSTFGSYTSASGVRYTPAFADNGRAYARTGVDNPQPNCGDGGRGGYGYNHANGKAGSDGCVIVYYNR